MSTTKTPERKKLVMFSIEPSLIERADQIADEFYGGNRSFLTRVALKELLDRKERELAERDAQEVVAA